MYIEYYMKNINIYNLFNEEAFILDFSNDDLLINFALKVSVNSYLTFLKDFSPDNLTHLIIISSNENENIIQNIETLLKFKNYYFLKQSDKIRLYSKFPILFDGENNTYPSLIHFLLPKIIFLGSVKTVTKYFLTSNNINKIINMTFKKLNVDIEKGIEENYPIEDNDNVDISNILDQTFDVIEKNNNILIVCDKGKSRSVSIILYYYAKKFNLSLEHALKNLKYCRSICDPNQGFINQIKTKLFL